MTESAGPLPLPRGPTGARPTGAASRVIAMHYEAKQPLPTNRRGGAVFRWPRKSAVGYLDGVVPISARAASSAFRSSWYLSTASRPTFWSADVVREYRYRMCS